MGSNLNNPHAKRWRVLLQSCWDPAPIPQHTCQRDVPRPAWGKSWTARLDSRAGPVLGRGLDWRPYWGAFPPASPCCPRNSCIAFWDKSQPAQFGKVAFSWNNADDVHFQCSAQALLLFLHAYTSFCAALVVQNKYSTGITDHSIWEHRYQTLAGLCCESSSALLCSIQHLIPTSGSKE